MVVWVAGLENRSPTLLLEWGTKSTYFLITSINCRTRLASIMPVWIAVQRMVLERLECLPLEVLDVLSI